MFTELQTWVSFSDEYVWLSSVCNYMYFITVAFSLILVIFETMHHSVDKSSVIEGPTRVSIGFYYKIIKMKKCFKVVFIFIKNCINCNTVQGGQGMYYYICVKFWQNIFFFCNERTLKEEKKSPKTIPYKLIIFLYSFILRSYSQGSTEYCNN